MNMTACRRSAVLLGALLFAVATPIVAADAQNGAVDRKPRRLAPGPDGVVSLSRSSGPRQVQGAYRVIETFPGKRYQGVTIDGLTATDIQREGIRLRGAEVRDIVLRNFRLIHGPQPNVAPDLPEGIHVTRGTNILIENGEIAGFQMTLAPDRYWNGDGIAAEGPVDGLVIRNVTVRDNTDAGIDSKARNLMLDRVTSYNNSRNIRVWGGFTATTLTLGDTIVRGGSTAPAQIWVKGDSTNPPVVRIEELVVRASTRAPIFRVEDGPATISIGRCQLDVPRGTRFAEAGNKDMSWDLGPGCKLH